MDPALAATLLLRFALQAVDLGLAAQIHSLKGKATKQGCPEIVDAGPPGGPPEIVYPLAAFFVIFRPPVETGPERKPVSIPACSPQVPIYETAAEEPL